VVDTATATPRQERVAQVDQLPCVRTVVTSKGRRRCARSGFRRSTTTRRTDTAERRRTVSRAFVVNTIRPRRSESPAATPCWASLSQIFAITATAPFWEDVPRSISHAERQASLKVPAAGEPVCV